MRTSGPGQLGSVGDGLDMGDGERVSVEPGQGTDAHSNTNRDRAVAP